MTQIPTTVLEFQFLTRIYPLVQQGVDAQHDELVALQYELSAQYDLSITDVFLQLSHWYREITGVSLSAAVSWRTLNNALERLAIQQHRQLHQAQQP